MSKALLASPTLFSVSYLVYVPWPSPCVVVEALQQEPYYLDAANFVSGPGGQESVELARSATQQLLPLGVSSIIVGRVRQIPSCEAVERGSSRCPGFEGARFCRPRALVHFNGLAGGRVPNF